MASQIKVDQLAGAAGNTVTIPAGQTLDVLGTLDIDGGTLVLPNTVVTTTGTQTLSNKTINASQLVDGSVATGKVADNAITLAKMASGTDGNIISYDTSGNPVAVATGSSGQVLTSAGAGAIPSFQAVSAGDVTLNGTQTLTNKTLTAPKIGTSILDTNGNELALLTATGSAVNEFTLANAASGNAPRLSSTGESNVDLDLLAKGTGHVTIRGNSNVGTIQLNCENNSHGQQLKAQPHSVGSSAVSTLPNVTGELVPGKIQGANFTNSLLIGHATTGTLNNANSNTGVGIGAMDAMTSGDDSTFIGYNAGTSNTTGTINTGVGASALSKNINGQNNVAVGYQSLYNNTSGNFNTAIGRMSGDNITSGSGNIIVGEVDADSATGNRQLKIAGYDGSTRTTWISGDSDGLLTITGGEVIPGKSQGTNFSESLLVGHSNTGTLNSAVRNVGVGIDALDAITTGDDNTALGYRALSSLTTGLTNTGLGNSALFDTTSGASNTGIGYNSLNNSTGNTNTALGRSAGFNLTSGSGNVVIGHADFPSASGSRQLVIAGYDGSTRTTWISGDSSGNLVTPGTITANSVVLTGVAADNSITLAKMAGGTDGNIISYDTSGNPVAVATGSSGQVLTSAGAGAVPTFADAAAAGTEWQAVKTSNFTAAAGQGVFCNTTSASFTLTLPAGTLGNEISFIDYAGTFDSNPLTIASNGSEKIAGSTANLTVSVERAANTLVYTDGTQGWLLTSK